MFTADSRNALLPAEDALTPDDGAGEPAALRFDHGTISLDGGHSTRTEPAISVLANTDVPILSSAVVTDGTATLFFADDGVHGRELWITDGTPEGTMLLADISPGQQSSSSIFCVPYALDDKWLFWANDGTHGNELWITDGTPEGTVQVKDIALGYSGSGPSPESSIALLGNGAAVFSAFTATYGSELWITDGTEAGTVLVADIRPGYASYGPYDSSPHNLTAIGGGEVLFTAYDTNGIGLWVTDGTNVGTVLVKSFNGRAGQITPFGNGLALFAADDGVHGYEPWVTDGTEAGTTLLKDIYPGYYYPGYYYGSVNGGFTPLDNSRALFPARDAAHGIELWVTDGTAEGTYLVADIWPGSTGSYPEFYALGNGTALVAAGDGVLGQELWITDGTAAGTVLLADINPQAGSYPYSFSALRSGLWVFVANDGAHGPELWITDGTAVGTMLVKDINPGSAGSSPHEITALGDGRALFSANDSAHGQELWLTDGTEAGTFLLEDIRGGTYGSSPSLFATLGNGTVVFRSVPSYPFGLHTYELWVTDGTAAGTAVVQPFDAISEATTMGNGKALLQASDGTHGYEVWVTDGTAAGTYMLTDIESGRPYFDYYPGGFTPLGNGLTVFYAGPLFGGTQIWVTDGTVEGTQLVKDVRVKSFSPLGNGSALFHGFDDTHGNELWVTDGTSDGTYLVADIRPGSDSSGGYRLYEITAISGGRALFAANDGASGYELWVSDGTTAGTVLVSDVRAGRLGSSPQYLTSLGNDTAVFSAQDGAHGFELWVSNGTAVGTALVLDINAGSYDSAPNGFVPLGNGQALFQADNGNTGRETWITDGTTAGTMLVADIRPGLDSAGATRFSPFGQSTALFSANDGVYGSELWFTNGTAAGTRLVKDINPGSGSSSPGGLTAIGDGTMIFSADDGVHGRELWITDGTAAGTRLVEDINSNGLGSTVGGFTVSPVPCYCRGTMILTDRGQVPVEYLEIGDRVVTLSKKVKPIKWIGRRAYDGRFTDGSLSVLPVRIAAGALADDVPLRDLWVSPEHSLCFEGVLVQAMHLLNGATITQPNTAHQVEYFHIELEEHDIIFAEGAPAETFVDCDNRLMFENGAEFESTFPANDRSRWEFCLPRLEEDSAELTGIRASLLRRAEMRGYRLHTDPDLQAIVDGRAVLPEVVDGLTYRFSIPSGSTSVWLVSRSTVPAQADVGKLDVRRLGVAVARLTLHDGDTSIDFALNDPALREGFHDLEGAHRWTDGRGRIPAAWFRRFAGSMWLDTQLAARDLGYRVLSEMISGAEQHEEAAA